MGGRVNYYEHHLGDYAKDTGHLSMLEHGAYRIQLDHVIPRSRGGVDTPDNLVACCKPCNTSKGALTPDEWGARNG